MFEDILTKTFYDNTISEWGVSLLFVVGAVVIGKIAYWISSKVLRRLVAKTETKLDDIIPDMIEEPIIFAVTVAGIWYGLGRLTMPEAAWSWISAGVQILFVLAGLGIGGLALAMAARVTTLAGTMVTIPNATFSDTAVENVSAEPSHKVTLGLGLSSDTSPEGMERRLEILRGIVVGNDNLEEKVLAAFTEFGEFSMNLLFIYYIKKDADILESQTQVNMEILRQFTAAGLEFAFPAQMLYTIPQTTTA